MHACTHVVHTRLKPPYFYFKNELSVFVHFFGAPESLEESRARACSHDADNNSGIGHTLARHYRMAHEIIGDLLA
jgi:hypothetical protein